MNRLATGVALGWLAARWRGPLGLEAGEEVDLPGAVRPTLGGYNSEDEVGRLVEMVERLSQRRWTGRYGEVASPATCKEL
jgi:hypothetical protein